MVSLMTKYCWLAFALLLAGCSQNPVYINDAHYSRGQAQPTGFNPVRYKFDAEFHRTPPRCIAVMPFHKESNTTFLPETSPVISDAELKHLRRVLYSHLAPYPYKVSSWQKSIGSLIATAL